MSTAVSVVFLLLGLAVGAVLGWLVRDRRQDETPPPAHDLVPLENAMAGLNQHLHALEKDRAGDMATLASQLQTMMRTSARLNDRTEELVTALRSPNVRGRWGEMQLERVVEPVSYTHLTLPTKRIV